MTRYFAFAVVLGLFISPLLALAHKAKHEKRGGLREEREMNKKAIDLNMNMALANKARNGRGRGLREESEMTKKAVNMDIDLLTKVYGLKSNNLGPQVLYGVLYESGSDHPLASAYLIVAKDVCGFWTTFSHDRLYLWHAGKAMVDIINSDGSYTTVCLGDTLEDKDCRFFIGIPAGTIVDLRTKTEDVILTGISLGTTMQDGKVVSLKELENKYKDTKLFKFLEDTEICYKESTN